MSKHVNGDLKRRIRDDIYDVQLEYIQPVSTIIYNRDYWNDLEITRLFQNVREEGKMI